MIVRKIVQGRDVYECRIANRIRTTFCLAFVKLLERQTSFPKFPLVFATCPLKSNMMEQVQSLRNNKITAACTGESVDIDRKLATGTTEFRLF